MSRIVFLSSIFVLLFCPLTAWGAYEKPYVGDIIEYDAEFEDTFVHLARDYNLGFVEMRAANSGVDPWIPGEGMDLILPTRHLLPDAPHEGIVINIPEMRLYAFVNGDGPPSTFPLGVGREGLETPVGETKIVRKKEGPTWYPNARMRKEDPELEAVVPPGPENPLGTHALYFEWPQYAIHGTNRPFGIGRRVSSGCIRMYPEDITQLYGAIPVGTKVTVVNQPLKLAWIDNKLYLEAHTTQDQAIPMEEEGRVEFENLSEENVEQIIKMAGPYWKNLNWKYIYEVVNERRGYPIVIARRSSNKKSLDDWDIEIAKDKANAALAKIYARAEPDKNKAAVILRPQNKTFNP